MQKILIIGEEERAQLLKNLLENKGFEIEISDGDEEEDFKDFDILFDINFDDDSENFPIYAGLRDKLIFLSTVKQSISESAYIFPSKVRSRIFGINSIEHYLKSDLWELSAFRGNEWAFADEFMKKIGQSYLPVEDAVGMYRPRVDFLAMNEKAQLLNENIISDNHPYIQKELKLIDEIGVTAVFETLMAIFEDTKELKYLPSPLLKKKYLRNHKMIRN